MAPRRQKNRRRRGRRQTMSRITEWFTFSVTNGNEQGVPASTLNVPSGFNFRPSSFEIEAMYYTPQAAPATAGFNPATGPVGAIQLQLYDSSGQRCATSRPVVTGSTPRSVTVRYPPSAGFWGATTNPTTVLGVINSICLGAQSVSYLRGVGRFRYTMTQEELVASCPTVLLNHELDPPDPSFLVV